MVTWTGQGLRQFRGRIVSFRCSNLTATNKETPHLKYGNGNKNWWKYWKNNDEI